MHSRWRYLGPTLRPRSPRQLLLFVAVIFPQHVERGRQERTVTLITGFRNYLHYHLKATKTYMHMRMRKRVVGLLQGKEWWHPAHCNRVNQAEAGFNITCCGFSDFGWWL